MSVSLCNQQFASHEFFHDSLRATSRTIASVIKLVYNLTIKAFKNYISFCRAYRFYCQILLWKLVSTKHCTVAGYLSNPLPQVAHIHCDWNGTVCNIQCPPTRFIVEVLHHLTPQSCLIRTNINKMFSHLQKTR